MSIISTLRLSRAWKPQRSGGCKASAAAGCWAIGCGHNAHCTRRMLQGSREHARLRRPSLRAEQHPMLHALDIDVIDPQVRPRKALLEFGQRDGFEMLMDLNHIEHAIVWVDALEILDDLRNRWLCPSQIQPGCRAQCIPPRRRQEGDDKLVRRQA